MNDDIFYSQCELCGEKTNSVEKELYSFRRSFRNIKKLCYNCYKNECIAERKLRVRFFLFFGIFCALMAIPLFFGKSYSGYLMISFAISFFINALRNQKKKKIITKSMERTG